MKSGENKRVSSVGLYSMYHIDRQGLSVLPPSNCQICSLSLYVHSHCLCSDSQFSLLESLPTAPQLFPPPPIPPLQSMLHPTARVIFHCTDLIPITFLLEMLQWSSL